MSLLHTFGLFAENGELVCDAMAHTEKEAIEDITNMVKIDYEQKYGEGAVVRLSKDDSDTWTVRVSWEDGTERESLHNQIVDMGDINNEKEHQRRCDEMYDRLLKNGAYIFRAEYLEGVLEFPHETAAGIATRELYEYCWKETEL